MADKITKREKSTLPPKHSVNTDWNALLSELASPKGDSGETVPEIMAATGKTRWVVWRSIKLGIKAGRIKVGRKYMKGPSGKMHLVPCYEEIKQ